MNTIIVVGHLGNTPELAYTPTGTATVHLSVADNLPRKNGAEQPPQWFNVTAFGQLAETAEQYLRKGSHVLVQGRLQRRDYTTKDKRAGTSLDIVADKIEFLDPKGEPTPEDAEG